MNPQMEITFSPDRNMLAALHVAVRTVLKSYNGAPDFLILSTDLEDSDIHLLQDTCEKTGKKFSLRFLKIDPSPFAEFPKWGGNHATYFRLLIPEISNAGRCLYLDCDIFCRTGLEALSSFDLGGMPLALAPEAPIDKSADKMVFTLLGEKAKGFYHNAGVSLIDCHLWRAGSLKKKCFDFILKHKPQYCDQSALNYCFHGEIAPLPAKFNLHTNVRANWQLLRKPISGMGCLLHFVDYPKPWSQFGKWAHPFGKMWWEEYCKTSHYKINCQKPAPVRWDSRSQVGYRKALKDKVLFSLFNKGLFLPKGVPAQ
jgi:lipopolysaccharide biosynthesis glycosyltransferase